MSVVPVDQALQIAIRHHQVGQLRQAEQFYRQILSQVPNHPDALHLLGVLAGQAGQVDAGIELIQHAIAASGTQASYYSNLSQLLMLKGQLEDAIAACRRALQLDSNYAGGYNNLGNALKQKGELAEAIAAYQKAIGLQPGNADAHNNLGNALNQQRCYERALPILRLAIELNPALAEAHSNLGTTLKALGQKEEALGCFRRAVELQPNHPELLSNLGLMLVDLGQTEEAIAFFSKILQLRPGDLNAYINLGNALAATKRYPEAIACYRQALGIRADYAPTHYNLGITLAFTDQVDEAIVAFETAIRLKPDYAEAYNNLGNLLKDAGRVVDAVDYYRQAMKASPEFGAAHSNLLHTLLFHPDYDAEALRQEHTRWNQQRGEPLAKFIQTHSNERDPERRLRVGYLSPDFCSHVIGRNMLPLFREHDHAQVEVFCYSMVRRPDGLTEQFRGYADHWKPIGSLSDAAVVDLIRRDGIDILVDLTLHLAHNRLTIFGRKPAPVQLTFAGYPGTTGLTTMDYRFTDPYLDPLGADVSVYCEKSLRLRDTFWVYDPLGIELGVGSLPAHANGFVTFGCLNNLCKVNDQVLRRWAQVLRGVPGSRFHLLTLRGSRRQRVAEIFDQEGVVPERITFVAPRPRAEYLALYNQMDICLDTFPYNGHTTSLDSLWMGVPVVTLVGKTVVGRAGVSQLSNLGLTELIAQTPEEYVRISTGLAADLPRLAALREALRARMERSPLMDAPRFARSVEAAYRQIWRGWCASSAASAGAT